MEAADLNALNVYKEAGAEPDDGKAAVARVVKNRMARKFFSDGTVAGTVLRKDQFSWAWFAFVTRPTGTIAPAKHLQEYVRVCRTRVEAEARADRLFAECVPSALAKCADIAARVMSGEYHSPLYDRLGDGAVSYINPRILTKLPTWAIPSKLIVSIGRHDFYGA